MGADQPSGDRLERAKLLLLEAQGLAPAAAAAWVRAQVVDDPAIGDYVLQLLDGGDGVAVTFAGVRAAAAEFVAGEQPQRIGRYAIVRSLGQGGMGTVYLAEQAEPVQRRVALKLVKLGMDSAAVVRRFEQERQALALMDHDGIAKVHDCGTSERGQPFFVMELVEGEPLTTFCDHRRLSLPQRLQLMQRVCDAVQHAHQKGVVHRDLKPTNVLVAAADGQPRVKIIDFGLAKAIDQRLGADPLMTIPGQILGTVEYMSPEQADAVDVDVDTRADVYSLGVMLHELLVGALPFAETKLRGAGMVELQRVLREVDPPRASARFASLPAAQREQVVAARAISPAALARALARDLDWVIAKAMEKDRSRRYDSPAALAADLQRFLDHEPLGVGPPSAGYRLRKFVRRNRGQVIAIAAVLVTAVVGGVVATNFALASMRLAEARAAKVREFDQLAGVVLLQRARERERELVPPWPERVEAMQSWLRDDVGRLHAMRPEIERTLADLRNRALPRTPAIVERDQHSHPRWDEYQRLVAFVDTLRRAQAVRDGEPPATPPPLSPRWDALDPSALWQQALVRVSLSDEQRLVPGDERLGLALAQRAAAGLAGTVSDGNARSVLAMALFYNGRDAEALDAATQAVAVVPAQERDAAQRRLADLRTMIGDARALLSQREADLMALAAEIEAPRTFEFELESQRFLYDTLAQLLADIVRFEGDQEVRVARRLDWARRIGELTRAHPHARHGWEEVRAAVARADGVVASELYRGPSIDLSDAAVMGLVPIGMNPVTRLWEFYDLRSAWDGRVDPATLAIPEHRADGSLALDDDCGLVFVLVPGGEAIVGSQDSDPSAPCYDPEAQWFVKPVHRVQLDAFLMSRYEMTQGQWRHLCEGDEAARSPSRYKAGALLPKLQLRLTAKSPVEGVDWFAGDDLLRENGMEVPTEVQWEYACRAGTTTIWSCAKDELATHANVADATARAASPQWGGYEDWADGHVIEAPVDSMLPNPWGFHHMHGNVAEWTHDCNMPYSWPARPGDGRREGLQAPDRMTRGGSMITMSVFAGSAMRSSEAATHRAPHIGVRPARALRR